MDFCCLSICESAAFTYCMKVDIWCVLGDPSCALWKVLTTHAKGAFIASAECPDSERSPSWGCLWFTRTLLAEYLYIVGWDAPKLPPINWLCVLWLVGECVNFFRYQHQTNSWLPYATTQLARLSCWYVCSNGLVKVSDQLATLCCIVWFVHRMLRCLQIVGQACIFCHSIIKKNSGVA